MKKVLKILAIILIIVIGVVIADVIYCKVAKVEPEDLYLNKENSTEQIKASRGTYQWTERGIIRNISAIADSKGPTSFDYPKVIETKVGDKIYFNDCEWTKVSASILLQKDRTELAKVPIESNLEENYIVIPELVASEYIVQINLKSDKGEVWYSAKIKITK